MIINEKYNFDNDINDHISNVKSKISKVINELKYRSHHHDDSKLVDPEYSAYKKFTPLLNDVEYQSDEYKKICNTKVFADACDHHCKSNRHHPEYYKNGIDGMDLVDLIEMISDWKAASERYQNASWSDGFKINCERFNVSPQLESILWNTYKNYFGGTDND